MPPNLQFTNAAQKSLLAAIELAKEAAHVHVTPIHLAVALLEESGGLLQSVLAKAGADVTPLQRALNKQLIRLPAQDPAPPEADLGPALHKVLRDAQTLMKNKNDSYISQDHFIVALLDDSSIQTALKEAELTAKSIKDAVTSLRAGKRVDSTDAEQGFEALRKYCLDLTSMANEGRLDPVISRESEIRRCITILCRRQKSNVVLIGEAGVGKTSVVEGLAQRIVARDVPPSLQGKLYSLDVGSLMAGASHRGDVEERVKSVLNEIEQAGKDGQPIILFIDEVHTIMSGESGSVANLLKPALARGTLHCIAATTLKEYRVHIEADAALTRRFGQVLVEEPTPAGAISILRGIRERYELHHSVTIQDAALVAAVQLAHRYLTAFKLPDSAIDILDEAAATVRLEREAQPEAIDKLERARLQLEVECKALERETTSSKTAFGNIETTKQRLEDAKKELAEIDEKLRPAQAAHQAMKARSDEIQHVRQRVDELKAKADKAERSYDLATAADIRHYALPDLAQRLEQLEHQKAEEDAARTEGPLDLVTADRIAEIVSRRSGIPVSRLQATETQRLLKMEQHLKRSIVGQPAAIKAVCDAIRLSRSGLNAPNRPTASFLFAGPSGVGKTQLAKALAGFMFSSPEDIIRIDCSEYSEKHSISRLIGAPPGYVGYDEAGQLTEAVRRKPYTVCLVDELEKANIALQQLFLQVLDAGHLTDGQGRKVDFKSTVIIFTSNVGSSYINAAPDGPITSVVKSQVEEAIRAAFLPEFLGRLDSVTIFNRLGAEQSREIIDLRLHEIQQRLNLNNKLVTISVTDAAKDWLAAKGVSAQYGARPLARVLQESVLVPLSRALLDGSIQSGVNEIANVDFDAARNMVFVQPNHEPEIEGDSMEVDDSLEIEEMD